MIERSLEEIQIALEEDMISLGINRYERNRNDEALLRPGKTLMTRAMPKLILAINEFIEKARTGKAGRKFSTLAYFEELDTEQIAYITLRKGLNAMVHEDATVPTAIAIGEAIDANHRMEELAADHAGLLTATLQKIKTRNVRHKNNALRRATREANVKGLEWTETDKLKIGAKLIELMIESTGLCTDELRKNARNRKTHVLVADPQVIEWLTKAHHNEAILAPMYVPMVVPPRPWTSPRSGGYLNEGVLRQVTLVRTLKRDTLDDVFSLEMPEVYNAINAIQKTPWKVNKSILDVFNKIRENQSHLGGLPYGADEELPPRPHGLPTADKMSRKDMPEDMKAILTEWLQESTTVHRRNASRRAKLLATAQISRVANQFVDFDAIYFPHSLDFRARIYSIPTGLSPQGNDLSKGLLQFSRGKALGEDGAYWLAVHVANVFGADKLPLDERAQWTLDHEDKILDSAFNPLNGERFWTEADDGATCWTALAACFEWAGYVTSGRSDEYVSHLPIAMDGSCSGLQHFSAMLRDPIGAAAVNLTPSETCSDIYTDVANIVVERVAAITDPELQGFVKAWEGKIKRKIVKQPCMTFAYSVTSRGMRGQIIDALNKIDPSGEYLGGVSYHRAAQFLAPIVELAIRSTVVAAAGAMDWLQEVSKIVSDENIPLLWSTPTGFPVLQDNKLFKPKRVEVTYLGQRVRFNLSVATPKTNKAKQKAGVAPNFVHSMDATHLMKTVNAGRYEGLRDFAMIHDSFGVHACDTTKFNAIIRNEFCLMYQENVLQKFAEQQQARILGALPELPEMGNFNLESVKKSDFFFA